MVYHDYDIFVNSHPHIDDYLAGTSVNDIVDVYIIIYLTIIFHRNNNIVLSKRVLLKS